MMNKIIAVITFLLFFTACKAGSKDAMHVFYAKHKSDTNVQQLSIPKFVLRFCADDPDLSVLLKHMKSLKIFTTDATFKQRKNITRDLKKALDMDAYEDVLEISETNEHIKILVREDKDLIQNVVITIENENELVVLQANTKITYEQMSVMLNGINTDKGKSGLHQLAGKSEG
jgi:hypothetical protein